MAAKNERKEDRHGERKGGRPHAGLGMQIDRLTRYGVDINKLKEVNK